MCWSELHCWVGDLECSTTHYTPLLYHPLPTPFPPTPPLSSPAPFFLSPPPPPLCVFCCAASCFLSSSGTREILLFINICFRSYMTSASSLPRKVMATPLLPARPVRPTRCV